MDVVFGKASKFYEPGEKVTGEFILTNWGKKFKDLKKFEVKAQSYMDTVSQIRGNMGRPPLEEKDRTYFMRKKVDVADISGSSSKKSFSFTLESTEAGEKLIDSYVGVEFSIVVSGRSIVIVCITVQIDSELR